jgi:hypothetical protein
MDKGHSLKTHALHAEAEGPNKKPGKSNCVSPKESKMGHTSGSLAKENTPKVLSKAVICTW